MYYTGRPVRLLHNNNHAEEGFVGITVVWSVFSVLFISIYFYRARYEMSVKP